MSRRCTICDNPQRGEIDRALINTAIGNVSNQFGVSDSSLFRHRKNCMAVAVALTQEARSRDLKQELLKLSKRAERIADEAERKGQLATAISGVREMSRLLAMEATFYPAAKSNKISVYAMQELVAQYNRGELKNDADDEDEVIEVEGSSVPDDDQG
jgi:hypothetical protein